MSSTPWRSAAAKLRVIFGIQYTTALCGVSIAFAVTQGKFTGEYVASLA